MHRTTERFRECFNKLPQHIQTMSRRNFELLKEDPSHPSLHFKKVGRFWSVRIGLNYRALAVEDGEDYIWSWIGNHNDYEMMIKNMG